LKFPEIDKAINDYNTFTKSSTGEEQTPEDIVRRVMSGKGMYPITIIEVDNESFRERGCPSGGCACKGRCKQLVPLTDLDRMCHKFYLDTEQLILEELKNNERPK
tara:strand:- start:83 stop:397 length:315 start_codon:yes stop_codon:yes gene_type:complete